MKRLLTAACLTLATTYGATAQVNPLTHRLAAYYPFWGHALDAFGNSHGTTMGGTNWVADRNGLSGGSLHLDGQTGYVDLGNSLDTVFAGPTAKFAITAWVKLNDPSYQWTSNRLIVTKAGDSGCNEATHEFYFRYLQGELNFSFVGQGASFARYINCSYNITDTLWHHLAVTYDATLSGNDGLDRVKLYVDGQDRVARLLPISFGALGHIGAGPAHLGIGNRLGSAGQPCQTSGVPGFFQGAIDDVAIYARVLTPIDVALLATPWRNGPLMVSPERIAPVIELFPTASTDGLFRVQASAAGNYAYTVINAVGQLVVRGSVRPTDVELNLSQLQKGAYMVRFTKNDGAVTQRIILE